MTSDDDSNLTAGATAGASREGHRFHSLVQEIQQQKELTGPLIKMPQSATKKTSSKRSKALAGVTGSTREKSGSKHAGGVRFPIVFSAAGSAEDKKQATSELGWESQVQTVPITLDVNRCSDSSAMDVPPLAYGSLKAPSDRNVDRPKKLGSSLWAPTPQNSFSAPVTTRTQRTLPLPPPPPPMPFLIQAPRSNTTKSIGSDDKPRKHTMASSAEECTSSARTGIETTSIVSSGSTLAPALTLTKSAPHIAFSHTTFIKQHDTSTRSTDAGELLNDVHHNTQQNCNKTSAGRCIRNEKHDTGLTELKIHINDTMAGICVSISRELQEYKAWMQATHQSTVDRVASCVAEMESVKSRQHAIEERIKALEDKHSDADSATRKEVKVLKRAVEECKSGVDKVAAELETRQRATDAEEERARALCDHVADMEKKLADQCAKHSGLEKLVTAQAVTLSELSSCVETTAVLTRELEGLVRTAREAVSQQRQQQGEIWQRVDTLDEMIARARQQQHDDAEQLVKSVQGSTSAQAKILEEVTARIHGVEEVVERVQESVRAHKDEHVEFRQQIGELTNNTIELVSQQQKYNREHSEPRQHSLDSNDDGWFNVEEPQDGETPSWNQTLFSRRRATGPPTAAQRQSARFARYEPPVSSIGSDFDFGSGTAEEYFESFAAVPPRPESSTVLVDAPPKRHDSLRSYGDSDDVYAILNRHVDSFDAFSITVDDDGSDEENSSGDLADCYKLTQQSAATPILGTVAGGGGDTTPKRRPLFSSNPPPPLTLNAENEGLLGAGGSNDQWGALSPSTSVSPAYAQYLSDLNRYSLNNLRVPQHARKRVVSKPFHDHIKSFVNDGIISTASLSIEIVGGEASEPLPPPRLQFNIRQLERPVSRGFRSRDRQDAAGEDGREETGASDDDAAGAAAGAHASSDPEYGQPLEAPGKKLQKAARDDSWTIASDSQDTRRQGNSGAVAHDDETTGGCAALDTASQSGGAVVRGATPEPGECRKTLAVSPGGAVSTGTRQVADIDKDAAAADTAGRGDSLKPRAVGDPYNNGHNKKEKREIELGCSSSSDGNGNGGDGLGPGPTTETERRRADEKEGPGPDDAHPASPSPAGPLRSPPDASSDRPPGAGTRASLGGYRQQRQHRRNLSNELHRHAHVYGYDISPSVTSADCAGHEKGGGDGDICDEIRHEEDHPQPFYIYYGNEGTAAASEYDNGGDEEYVGYGGVPVRTCSQETFIHHMDFLQQQHVPDQQVREAAGRSASVESGDYSFSQSDSLSKTSTGWATVSSFDGEDDSAGGSSTLGRRTTLVGPGSHFPRQGRPGSSHGGGGSLAKEAAQETATVTRRVDNQKSALGVRKEQGGSASPPGPGVSSSSSSSSSSSNSGSRISNCGVAKSIGENKEAIAPHGHHRRTKSRDKNDAAAAEQVVVHFVHHDLGMVAEDPVAEAREDAGDEEEEEEEEDAHHAELTKGQSQSQSQRQALNVHYYEEQSHEQFPRPGVLQHSSDRLQMKSSDALGFRQDQSSGKHHHHHLLHLHHRHHLEDSLFDSF